MARAPVNWETLPTSRCPSLLAPEWRLIMGPTIRRSNGTSESHPQSCRLWRNWLGEWGEIHVNAHANKLISLAVSYFSHGDVSRYLTKRAVRRTYWPKGWSLISADGRRWRDLPPGGTGGYLRLAFDAITQIANHATISIIKSSWSGSTPFSAKGLSLQFQRRIVDLKPLKGVGIAVVVRTTTPPALLSRYRR